MYFQNIFLNNHTKENLTILYDDLINDEDYEKAGLVNYLIKNGYYKEQVFKNSENTKLIGDLLDENDQFIEHVDDAIEYMSEAEKLDKEFEDLPKEEQERINKIMEYSKTFDEILKDVEIHASEEVYNNMKQEHFHLPDEKMDKIYQYYYNYYLKKAKNNNILD